MQEKVNKIGVIAFGTGIMLFILGGMGWIGGTDDVP